MLAVFSPQLDPSKTCPTPVCMSASLCVFHGFVEWVVGFVSFCCLTSTEARGPIRDGDEWGERGQKSETSKQAPTSKTKAAVDRRQNNRMLRRCPSGIAQRPPHHAIAVPTAMQNRVTKTMSVAILDCSLNVYACGRQKALSMPAC